MDTYQPGQRVSVTQLIPHGDRAWSCCVVGEVVGFEQRKTGSWYAHAKDHKLWLDRLILRKEDGEIVECVLEPHSQVVVLDDLHPTPAPRDATSAGNAHAA